MPFKAKRYPIIVKEHEIDESVEIEMRMGADFVRVDIVDGTLTMLVFEHYEAPLAKYKFKLVYGDDAPIPAQSRRRYVDSVMLPSGKELHVFSMHMMGV